MHFCLETENLVLREFRAEDAPSILALDSNAEVHRYLGDQLISTLSEAASVVDRVREQYEENRIARWIAIERSSGKFIGWSGLKLNVDAKNEQSQYYDVGYRFLPEFWGKGYATESAKRALDYGFGELNIPTIVGTCHVENLASRRVLEKCGLRFKNNFSWNGLPCAWLEIERPERYTTT